MYARLTLGLIAAVLVAGCQGLDGTNGVDGVDGVDGTNGTNGTNGANGTDGTDGADGTDGVDWPGPVPAAYDAADGIAGGAAYSQWYSAPGGGTGALADYDITVGADFTRCKACHGWDGLGSAGSYANRTGVSTGTTTRPDVDAVNLRATVRVASYDQLFELIDRPDGRYMDSPDSRHPDYSEYLSEEQVWDIVKFMREEAVNPNELYDMTITGADMHYDGSALISPTITYSSIGQDGDKTNGVAIYNAECALCHGADGKTNPPGGTQSVGQFTRAKPYESWFKIKFGEPGKMDAGLVTSTEDLKDLYAALADSTLYPNK